MLYSMLELFLYFLFHFIKKAYICSANKFIGAANSYGLHWSYFFAKTYISESNIL